MKDHERPWLSDPTFDGFPLVREMLTAIDNAKNAYHSRLETILSDKGLTRGECMAVAMNSTIHLFREVLVAKSHYLAAQGIEYQDPEETLRNEILKINDRVKDGLNSRPRPLGLRRATYVQTAYVYLKANATLSPMDTALEWAAIMEMADRLGALGDSPIMRKLFSYYKERGSELPTQTVRKSVQRYRQSIKDEEVFYFDRDTLTWAAEKTEEAFLPRLPNGRGRPKSK